jgi:WW domain-containing adapter protein with coiled-coil
LEFLENADMEISPDSTPTSEPSYSSPSALANSSNIPDDPGATATSPNGHVPSKHHNNQSSTSSAARLQQNSKQNSTVASSSSPHNYHSSHHHRHRSVSPLNDALNDTNNSNSIRNSPAYGNNVPASNNHLIGDGPPTPEMDLNSAGDHRRSKLPKFPSMKFTDSTLNLSVDGASGGVSSLQNAMMGAASQVSNRLNLLTPSLAKFFRVDLLNHVTNWPSELLEKQVRVIEGKEV